MLRRTKIVVTLGPATDRPGELERVVKNGMDVARVNFSHGEPEQHLRRVQMVREIAEANGRHVGVMVDLQGPKIRIEGFKQRGVTLSDGARFILDPGLGSDEGTEDRVGVTYKSLAENLLSDDILLLDDGNIVMQVDQVSNNQIHCRVLNGGPLTGFKGLNRLGGGLSADALTAKDHADIQTAARARADYLAVSFVRFGDDVVQARDLFQAAGGDGGCGIDRGRVAGAHAGMILGTFCFSPKEKSRMSPLILVDLEFFEVFATRALQQNFDFLFGVIKRALAAASEFNAVLELLHGFLERQVTGLEFLDQFFEVPQCLLEVEFLCRTHKVFRYKVRQYATGRLLHRQSSSAWRRCPARVFHG